MKEKIYTIPVMEAFKEDCECPLCLLEKKLEDEYIDYILGPSLMEPDGREVTNEKGFCRRHYELLFKRQSNKLGLALILDTHLVEQNKKLKKLFDSSISAIKGAPGVSALKNLLSRSSSKQTGAGESVDDLISALDNLESKCAVCSKLDYTMDRYIDVIFYLWSKERDFKDLFQSKKGFCLRHLKMLLAGAKKHLRQNEFNEFVVKVLEMQQENMERIQQEVNWFTKKFDYRYNDAPWGNSKDSVSRSIQKLAGYMDLK
ncbi:ABC transporter substrate-binding protein [Clostridium thermosuccinogenes]|jgi:hypothetical protein|uniref:ABC transporter substrate-binding protein n=1 Tax=Clostridium thermosuccinogenes TaxID=84032 RepID=A0A2K2FIL4_9CLOT|nr:DUF6062 family protein [Pseudoclostridium thermosuccinogenes]AUS95226.1 ABC transporter substrate-binding protein [Pseudoclostridium thermosuccinogenes]PNT96784.1 ABC transporter substrate-binding protein [Pseudoclostridium thermosuccinogenes]PNT98621.1 ABC transporter substrate-binding protein [Pseudoclostridium thermosuccinogenes]